MLCYRRLIDDDQAAQLRLFVSRGSVSSRTEAAEFEDQRGAIFLPASKALFCHSPRASRRIPVFFLQTQKFALIESINPQ